MSQFMLCSVKIKNANASVLRRAVQLLAASLEAETVSEIRDYYGRTRSDFVLGIRTERIARGVGFTVVNGEVKMVGDFYGVPQSAVQELQQKLVQFYSAAALEQALQQAGYQVQVEVEQVSGKVLVRGVV